MRPGEVFAFSSIDTVPTFRFSHPSEKLGWHCDVSCNGNGKGVQFLFFLAPLAPFLVLGGVVMAVKDRFLLTGLLVIVALLTLSCGVYLQAQADQRAHPAALYALVYLVIPFLQIVAAAVAFGLLAVWRAWLGRKD